MPRHDHPRLQTIVASVSIQQKLLDEFCHVSRLYFFGGTSIAGNGALANVSHWR